MLEKYKNLFDTDREIELTVTHHDSYMHSFANIPMYYMFGKLEVYIPLVLCISQLNQHEKLTEYTFRLQLDTVEQVKMLKKTYWSIYLNLFGRWTH